MGNWKAINMKKERKLIPFVMVGGTYVCSHATNEDNQILRNEKIKVLEIEYEKVADTTCDNRFVLAATATNEVVQSEDILTIIARARTGQWKGKLFEVTLDNLYFVGEKI